MKKPIKNILAGGSAIILSLLCAATVSAEEAGDGFVELFNGKDLTGWKTTGYLDIDNVRVTVVGE